MTVALPKPWTPERFLAWAESQESRYEFDGTWPVPMTGGNARHNHIAHNLYAALRRRLRGGTCSYYGPDLGIRTVGAKIRYPDALITCTRFDESGKLAPDVIVVFEIVSPSSGGLDHTQKLREYEAVPSILRYVVAESESPGVQVFHRSNGAHPWTAHAETGGDVLALPEVGIEFPIAEIYEDIAFNEGEGAETKA